MSKQLLPVGFYDLLFDEATQSHKNVNAALDSFFDAGYKLIKPPLVEFEENFSAAEVANSFRTTDVISGKNLVFRNDITLQISRLLNARLQQEKTPIKLCYVGDVLCAKSNDLYADRQQTQVGVEIIGCSAEESEEKYAFEIIELLLATLKKLAMEDLLIEFSLPNFLQIFIDEIVKIEESKKAELHEAIMKKSLSEIRNLAKENSEIICKIVSCNHNLEDLIAEISAQIKSQKILHELKKAQKIAQFIKDKKIEVALRFDLFGDHESSYHNKLSFDVFSGRFSYAIARGGSYKINNYEAVGSTIYMNRLRKIK